MFVLHLDQTSNGVSLSCTDGSPVSASPLAFDTVFNIAEYKFTKSTDMNFSLLKKGTNNHPWFLRPVLVQCSFDFMVISYEKKKGFDKISCHMIWWMARIAWWWHSFTDAQYSSLSGTRTCPEKWGRVSKEVSLSSKRLGAVFEDIFGETGLIECETEKDFKSKLREEIIEWDLQKYVNANFNRKLLFNNNPL